MTTPTPDLGAKPGRLYVVHLWMLGTKSRFDLGYVGRDLGREPDTDGKQTMHAFARVKESARKFAAVGDAADFIAGQKYELTDTAIEPFDPPNSVDAELAAMHQRTLARERVAWVASGANGVQGEGKAS